MEYKDNVYTYLKWRGDLSVKDDPFNEVDALILSELSYIEFEGIVSGVGEEGVITINEANQIYKKKDSKNPYYCMKETLFDVLAKTKRFGSMTLCNYVSTIDLLEQQQFAAVHINVSPYITFIAFRGTDSSIVGWREDFNMTYMMPVPAQQSAVDYVNATAKSWFKKYWLGGHSKGGNLAIYSGVFCDSRTQRKIIKVNSFDGPGFNRKVINDAAYLAIKGRISAYVPDESIIGLLMEHEEDYKVVKSSESSIMQHEGFSWKISGTEFERAEGIDRHSKSMSDTLKSWLARISPEERKTVVNTAFTLFEKAGLRDFTEFIGLDPKTAGALLKAVTTVPKEERELVGRLVKLFVEESAKK